MPSQSRWPWPKDHVAAAAGVVVESDVGVEAGRTTQCREGAEMTESLTGLR